MKLGERMMARATGRCGERLLGGAAVAALAMSAALSLVVAPPDASQGNVQRLMYVHVPSAWLAYLSFTSGGGCKRRLPADGQDALGPFGCGVGRGGRAVHRAHHRARGVVGQAGLGHLVDLGPAPDHDRDPALIYLGYLALRRMADSPASPAACGGPEEPDRRRQPVMGRQAPTTRRTRVVVASAVIVAGLGWVAAKGLSSSLVYYLTPSDILAKGQAAVGERARLGGYVLPGSVQQGGSWIRFVVTDGSTRISVVDTGGVPSLFRADQGGRGGGRTRG